MPRKAGCWAAMETSQRVNIVNQRGGELTSKAKEKGQIGFLVLHIGWILTLTPREGKPM
jgi:hypothetical protein